MPAARKTSLHEWDQLVAPVLHRIEGNALICRERARHITAEVMYLHARPEFLTKAMDTLQQAKAELKAALMHLESAEQLYQRLPVEGDFA